jgi:hypothetical protein
MHHAFLPSLGFIVVGAFSILGLLELIFQIWMLIDAIQNPRLEGSQRVVWALVIIFMPCLGPVLYFFLGKSR